MSEYVTGTDGIQLPLDSLATVLTFDGSFVATITVVYNGVSYVQTFENDGDNITNISQWVAS